MENLELRVNVYFQVMDVKSSWMMVMKRIEYNINTYQLVIAHGLRPWLRLSSATFRAKTSGHLNLKKNNAMTARNPGTTTLPVRVECWPLPPAWDGFLLMTSGFICYQYDMIDDVKYTHIKLYKWLHFYVWLWCYDNQIVRKNIGKL